MGVGCHFLLQGIFLTQGPKPRLLHWKVDSLPLTPPGKPHKVKFLIKSSLPSPTAPQHKTKIPSSMWFFENFNFWRYNFLFPWDKGSGFFFGSVNSVFAMLWTVALQSPLSTGFSRQEYWSELPYPSLRDLPDPGIGPASPVSLVLQVGSSPTESPGKPGKGSGVGDVLSS